MLLNCKTAIRDYPKSFKCQYHLFCQFSLHVLVTCFHFQRQIENMATNQTNSLYHRITNQFIDVLKRGAPPWKKPWTQGESTSELPINAATERKYSGINITILWTSAVAHSFKSGRWLTFNQAKAVGGRVKRGQKGTVAVLYRDIEVPCRDTAAQQLADSDENPLKKTIKLVRGYTLFNVEQCAGLPKLIVQGPPQCDLKPTWKLHQEAENLVATHKVDVRYENDSACYNSTEDFINLPPKCAFGNNTDYYATLMHELTHWTGHSSRLDRPGISSENGVGSTEYAFEEMIAEIGSAFLCAEFRIPADPTHGSYILSWINVLENDPKAIFRSSAQAWKARNYLLGEETSC